MTELYIMNEDKDKQENKKTSEGQEGSYSNMNTDMDEPKATLFDEYYLLKALFVILIYILFFLTVGLSIFFWLESGCKAVLLRRCYVDAAMLCNPFSS